MIPIFPNMPLTSTSPIPPLVTGKSLCVVSMSVAVLTNRIRTYLYNKLPGILPSLAPSLAYIRIPDQN